MKDLDFDELDKAVTSLMGSVPTVDETVKPDDDVKTLILTPSKPLVADGFGMTPSLPITSSADTSLVPTPSNPVPVAQAAPTPAPAPMSAAPQVSPAARRAGRFMDVVHPSSDMTKSTINVSRHSGTIEPLSNNIIPSETPVEVETPTAVVSGTPQPAELQNNIADMSSHVASDWPDPLDMPHATPVPQEESSSAQSTFGDKQEPAPADDVQTSIEPLNSPFLPDAKVEKRPLGGAPTGVTELDAAVVDAPAPASDPQTTPPEVILPEELQGDLMAIESRQASTVIGTEPPRAPAPSPVVAPRPSVQAPGRSTGPTSIQQQYKSEQSTGDQTNGSIYDTDSYHKPLQHPVKKKSSVALIIWIVVLLIIGAGGGAAAYFYLLK
jgi:hypothetical protein